MQREEAPGLTFDGTLFGEMSLETIATQLPIELRLTMPGAGKPTNDRTRWTTNPAAASACL
jgi:hypothetical protein